MLPGDPIECFLTLRNLISKTQSSGRRIGYIAGFTDLHQAEESQVEDKESNVAKKIKISKETHDNKLLEAYLKFAEESVSYPFCTSGSDFITEKEPPINILLRASIDEPWNSFSALQLPVEVRI
jgi:hypothetical protein